MAALPHRGPSRHAGIALAGQHYDLRTVPITQVASITAGIGRHVDPYTGTARRILRAHVLVLHDHRPAPGTLPA